MITRNTPEHIFQVMKSTNRWYEGFLLPVSRGGQAYSYPTQELVDTYPMKNGKNIKETGSGYVEADMYKDRDPRFYYSILYDGSLWLNNTTNTKTVVNLYANAPGDGLGTSGSTKTGYLYRKFCHEGAGGNFGISNNIGLVAIRYAEILLNYAEALNEFSGPGTEVYQAIEQIRERAGLVPFQLPLGLTKEQMREVIRNERRVELTYEEAIRFFDIKRWKLAETLINGPAGGMRWTRSGSTVTGARFSFETRRFTNPQMYYFPIPQSEINKSAVLIQNPGW
ncbi:SusD family protein [compost metagenome]